MSPVPGQFKTWIPAKSRTTTLSTSHQHATCDLIWTPHSPECFIRHKVNTYLQAVTQPWFISLPPSMYMWLVTQPSSLYPNPSLCLQPSVICGQLLCIDRRFSLLPAPSYCTLLNRPLSSSGRFVPEDCSCQSQLTGRRRPEVVKTLKSTRCEAQGLISCFKTLLGAPQQDTNPTKKNHS